MTENILTVLLPIALAFIMFSLGLGLKLEDFSRVLRYPRIVATGIFCQMLLVPLTALLLISVFSPPPEIALGVMILSFCPGGVISNIMARLAGGTVALSVTLTGVVSLISVISLPFFTDAASAHILSESGINIETGNLGTAMFLITALPVSLGVALRELTPRFAENAEYWVAQVANIIFVIIVIASIYTNWDLFTQNFAELGPIMVLLNIILLVLGILAARLARLQRKDVITISLETGMQNSALGITIGSLVAEGISGLPVFSLPSGVYGITAYFVTLLFVAWARWSFLKADSRGISKETGT
jgi:BASS family bile acid:Na+ symporter